MADVTMAEIPRPDAVSPLIDEWWEKHKEGEPRPHLGASLLGHPCDRWLWLSFRWAVREHHPGRVLRLFDRGQREEAVIAENLRNIGVDIRHTSADDGGQVRVELAPYVSGSVDGIIEGGVPGAEKTRHIAEFKTHNLRSFIELKQKGVYNAKRQHWCQMQCYMHGTGIKRALYVAVCKDNDELYTERVEYNEQAAVELVKRGERIALCEHLPPLLSKDPTFYTCKFCPAWEFCHETHLIKPECVNCRTCGHSTPKADGTWECENAREFFSNAMQTEDGLKWAAELSEQDQREACSWHVVHPDMTPWDFCGADKYGNGIYVIDGARCVNGGDGNGSISAIQSTDFLSGIREPREQEDLPF